MLLALLASAALIVFLWSLFRLAMGLRYSKLAREEARRGEEARGRRVVAEIPLAADLMFFVEDAEGFYWGGRAVRRADVAGARMLLNGGVIGAFSRDGAPLPDPPAAEEYGGQERWAVVLYMKGGGASEIPCGSLREGVSREIAQRVFEAVRRGDGG